MKMFTLGFLSLIISSISMAQMNDQLRQASTSINNARSEISQAGSQLPYNTPSNVRDLLAGADRDAANAQFLISQAATATKLSFVYLIVDGKGNTLVGEGNSMSEAQMRAQQQCTRICNQYPILFQGGSQRVVPPKVFCQLIDGKGRTYNGQGETETDALVQPYAQCGVICTMYPHRKSCQSTP